MYGTRSPSALDNNGATTPLATVDKKMAVLRSDRISLSLPLPVRLEHRLETIRAILPVAVNYRQI